jgi:hypothetical protein
MMPKAVEGLDKGKIDDIYKNIIDLESVFTVKSYEELKSMLDEHYYCSSEASDTDTKPVKANKSEASASSATDSTDVLEDDTVKKLLEGLD